MLGILSTSNGSASTEPEEVRRCAPFREDGVKREVIFEPAAGSINDLIDDAYRKKYRGSPYLKAMIGAQARSATVTVIPE